MKVSGALALEDEVNILVVSAPKSNGATPELDDVKVEIVFASKTKGATPELDVKKVEIVLALKSRGANVLILLENSCSGIESEPTDTRPVIVTPLKLVAILECLV